MSVAIRWIRAVSLVSVALLAALVLGPAWATPLRGTITDALTEEPIEGAVVRSAAIQEEIFTDSSGSYELRGIAGAAQVLEVEAEGYHPVLITRQDGGHATVVSLLPLWIHGYELEGRLDAPTFGLPWNRMEAAEVPGRDIPLPLVSGPLLAIVPEVMPETIRVGRRFASTCRDNPVQQIDEMPFEDYVCGVLPPEIGVFKSVPGGPESARAVFEAFAVLARSYALWYSLHRGADADWHIDDTACEQRYEDTRDLWITEVVMSTAGQVLVKASDPGVIDKYEYAASCGRHGTRPAYQTEIVPDETPGRGCTLGGWCGHDNCAAHEANPNVSPPDNRCLVRGVCQWGSLERSLGGHSKQEILGHYQRNLVLIEIGAEPVGNIVGVVRADDLESGEPISGAEVRLGTGESVMTGAEGIFRFDGLPLDLYEITAEAEGFVTGTRERLVDAPGDNWASIALERLSDEEEPGDDEPDEEDPGGGGGGIGGPSVVSGGCSCAAADNSSSPEAFAWVLFVASLPWLRADRRRLSREGA